DRATGYAQRARRRRVRVACIAEVDSATASGRRITRNGAAGEGQCGAGIVSPIGLLDSAAVGASRVTRDHAVDHGYGRISAVVVLSINPASGTGYVARHRAAAHGQCAIFAEADAAAP